MSMDNKSKFDEWFDLTHKKTKASWDTDDTDDLDLDKIEKDED